MDHVRQYLCNKSSDSFCYICGLFVPISQRRHLNEQVKINYFKYFGIEVKNQDMCWVPHGVCSSCKMGLDRWAKDEGHLKYGKPMIWRDPFNHETNCYICLTDIVGFNARNRHSVKYAVVDSVTLPVLHSEEIPIPVSPAQTPGLPENEDELSEDEGEDEMEYRRDPLYIPDTSEPHPLTQGDLNDLVRDLNLSKSNSELLASRLQQWSLLDRGETFTLHYP